MFRVRIENENLPYIFGIIHKYFNFGFNKKSYSIKTLESIPKYYTSLTKTNWKIHQKIILIIMNLRIIPLHIILLN